MTAQRDAAIQKLRDMLDEITRARDLTAQGQSVPALRTLMNARRLGKQSIAVLLGNCLKAATEQADDESLARLRELIGFAEQALCRGCRSEVGKRWNESENV